MWKLLNIHAENLCAFKELDYQIPQNVTTLVFGNNLDNDSQGSNGSGKSALIECISIGITGEPLRRVKIDEIIRDDADEAVIAVILKNTNTDTVQISRKFFRKAPQEVEIIMNGTPVPQASVNDYNKFILELLGLTKDDIYSNFILSKNKYVSFLTSGDKEKKELINRFSNGVLVDESLEYLHQDITELERSQVAADKEVSFFEGKVSTLKDQIADLINRNNQSEKERRLSDINNKIAETREQIRNTRNLIQIINQDWDDLEYIDKEFQRIEKSDGSFSEKYQKIQEHWVKDILGELPDYESYINDTKEQIAKLNEAQVKSMDLITEYETDVLKLTEVLSEANKKLDYLTEQADAESEKLKKQIQVWKDTISKANSELQDLLVRKQKGNKVVSELMTMLSGSIECPQCHHIWVVDCDFSVDEINKRLENAKHRQTELDQLIEQAMTTSDQAKNEITKSNSKNSVIEEKVTAQSSKVSEVKIKMNQLQRKLQELKDDVRNTESLLLSLNKRITSVQLEMFNGIYDKVDLAIKKYNNQIKQYESEIASYEGVIDTLEATKKSIIEYSIEETIAPLKQSLLDAEKTLSESIKNKSNIDSQLSALLVQETRFTEFKTYLANSKVDALSAMTNEFLAAIGSDIRISFSGYTLLKSGKVRDKISISLLRDGIDCGSFGKFSQGERSRCELATILALQKLINTNCEEGKGLDLLVIDEIMDGIDEDGLSCIFETLNKLQVTSLVVSHGLIHEGYQHRLIINKQNGISYI